MFDIDLDDEPEIIQVAVLEKDGVTGWMDEPNMIDYYTDVMGWNLVKWMDAPKGSTYVKGIKRLFIDEHDIPELTIENADDDGILRLAQGIVQSACADYVRGDYNSKHTKSRLKQALCVAQKEDAEEFLRGEWYRKLVMEGISPDATLRILNAEWPPVQYMTAAQKKKYFKYLEQLEKERGNNGKRKGKEQGRISDDPGALPGRH